MLKDFLFTAIYLLLFNFLIGRFRCLQLKKFKPWVTLSLFNVKLFTGILIWIVYTFYYSDVKNNDIHKFYADARILHQLSTEHPISLLKVISGGTDEYSSVAIQELKNWNRNFDDAPINENRTVILLNALLMFLSGQTYFVHILFMCLISLVGFLLLFNSLFGEASADKMLLALPILFLPSVLFWTNGVLKEPILMFGLGLFVHSLIMFELKPVNLILLLLAVLVILSVKFYVLACLLPAALCYLIFRKVKTRSQLYFGYLFTLSCFAVSVLLIPKINPAISPLQVLINKQTHAVKEAEYFKAGSRVEIPVISDESSLFKAGLVGIFHTLFRPYLWESKNPMMLLSGLENTVIVSSLLFYAMLYKKQSLEVENLALILLISSIFYFALIGASTPVLGNLVRYKAPFLSLFLFAFVLQTNSNFDLKRFARLFNNR